MAIILITIVHVFVCAFLIIVVLQQHYDNQKGTNEYVNDGDENYCHECLSSRFGRRPVATQNDARNLDVPILETPPGARLNDSAEGRSDIRKYCTSNTFCDLELLKLEITPG